MNCIKIVFSGLRFLLLGRHAGPHSSAGRRSQIGRPDVRSGRPTVGQKFWCSAGRPNLHVRQAEPPWSADRSPRSACRQRASRCPEKVQFFSAVLILFLGRFWETLNLDMTGNMKCSIHTGLRTWRWILHEEGYSLRIQGWRINNMFWFISCNIWFLFSRVGL